MLDEFVRFLRSTYDVMILKTELNRVQNEIQEVTRREFQEKGYDTTTLQRL